MRAPWNGPAQVLDRKTTTDVIETRLAERVAALHKHGVVPGFGTVLVDEDPDSVVYMVNKHRNCAEIGIESIHVNLPASATQEQIETTMDRLNADPVRMGCVVQLPLPEGIDQSTILERIDPERDADGLHPTNLERLVLRGSGPIDSPLPCTPGAAIELMTHHGINLRGKHVCIVDHGVAVDHSTGLFLIRREVDATVTICHTETEDLAAQVRQADVTVAAAGSVGLITRGMVRPRTIVLDIDVSRVVGEGGKSRLVGDVTSRIDESAPRLFPNPGGIGPVAQVLLVTNVVEAAEHGAKRRQREGADQFLPTLRSERETVMQSQTIPEVGPLRSVLVHRSGQEMNRLTSSNIDEFLFDDPIRLECVQAEHDAMTSLVRKHGIRIFYFTDLLTETLEVKDGRKETLELVFTRRTVGPAVLDALRGFAAAFAPAGLVGVLIEGLTKHELSEKTIEPHSAWTSSLGLDNFIPAPLSNHLFTQDASS